MSLDPSTALSKPLRGVTTGIASCCAGCEGFGGAAGVREGCSVLRLSGVLSTCVRRDKVDGVDESPVEAISSCLFDVALTILMVARAI